MSAVKRSLAAKDWGSGIAGHGGYMDRLDSLAFAAPVFFTLFVGSGFRKCPETIASQKAPSWSYLSSHVYRGRWGNCSVNDDLMLLQNEPQRL